MVRDCETEEGGIGIKIEFAVLFAIHVVLLVALIV